MCHVKPKFHKSRPKISPLRQKFMALSSNNKSDFNLKFHIEPAIRLGWSF